MKKPMMIIYVADQEVSKEFYRKILGAEPVLNVPGMTEFAINDGLSLGLMPEKGIAALLGDSLPDPAKGNGIPRCELYLFVDDPQSTIELLEDAGGKLLSPAEKQPWGDIVAYGADPDGHVLAFAR